MFFLMWFIGSALSVVCELALAALGFTLSVYGSGLIIALVITIGLIMYGTKTKKQIGGN